MSDLEAKLIAALNTEAIELDDAALDFLHRRMTENIESRRQLQGKENPPDVAR